MVLHLLQWVESNGSVCKTTHHTLHNVLPELSLRPGLGAGGGQGNFELHVRLDVIRLEN